MSEDSAGSLFLLFSLVLLPAVRIFVTRPPLKHLWTVAVAGGVVAVGAQLLAGGASTRLVP